MLGVSRRRIDQLAEEGLLKRSDKSTFPLDESVLTYIEMLRVDARHQKSERANLARAQTDYKRFQLARDTGMYLKANEVEAWFSSLVGTARQRILVLTARIKSRCPTLPDKVLHEIGDVVRDALEELSSAGLPKRIRDAVEKSSGDLGTTAEDESVQLG